MALLEVLSKYSCSSGFWMNSPSPSKRFFQGAVSYSNHICECLRPFPRRLRRSKKKINSA